METISKKKLSSKIKALAEASTSVIIKETELYFKLLFPVNKTLLLHVNVDSKLVLIDLSSLTVYDNDVQRNQFIESLSIYDIHKKELINHLNNINIELLKHDNLKEIISVNASAFVISQIIKVVPKEDSPILKSELLPHSKAIILYSKIKNNTFSNIIYFSNTGYQFLNETKNNFFFIGNKTLVPDIISSKTVLITFEPMLYDKYINGIGNPLFFNPNTSVVFIENTIHKLLLSEQKDYQKQALKHIIIADKYIQSYLKAFVFLIQELNNALPLFSYTEYQDYFTFTLSYEKKRFNEIKETVLSFDNIIADAISNHEETYEIFDNNFITNKTILSETDIRNTIAVKKSIPFLNATIKAFQNEYELKSVEIKNPNIQTEALPEISEEEDQKMF